MITITLDLSPPHVFVSVFNKGPISRPPEATSAALFRAGNGARVCQRPLSASPGNDGVTPGRKNPTK
ncbi:hypothetical protein B5X24_HaOG207276 [Helicoverpa armigera]|uniref:Uncharacterized protein n=1 Tax=Helicoverpa armigera TaxID=29058 RepID=A0A2W1BPW2_HELAM|nr:hypothetical protein B5X24_HaOG207276 [Helicoverpa armigera]